MADPVRVFGGVAASPSAGPVRTCVRCESLAEQAKQHGWPVPPVAPAHSWLAGVRNGVRVRRWGALCVDCEELERQVRAKRAEPVAGQPAAKGRR